ncbi:hypothetical protein GBA65_01245 [Rubrobacter marinus]|uniref:Uncharacterized protein n=1 Tax=Rubrobacter marinus TaxID=2653852 RepID=A0A6G8PTF4_9ACTN|nr:hypothetical protein [Rubrobacter marinus]QIN77362.1 hypothetical protein GBA65_01245 [Rubrobacter marinus]
MDGVRRYMAGDVVRMGLVLEHASNLSRVFVAFSHERDPLTELYFEATYFPAENSEWTADGSKRTRVMLEAPLPPETVPGVYGLNRVNAFSVGGKLSRLREEDLRGLPGTSFEVVEEPAEPPTVAGLEFLA